MFVCILYITLWANSADDKLMVFFPENRQIDISCRLSPGERKLLFSKENKKKNEFEILLNWPIYCMVSVKHVFSVCNLCMYFAFSLKLYCVYNSVGKFIR